MDGLLKLFLDTDRKHYVLELFKLVLTLVTSVKLYDFLFGIQLQPIPITANYLQDVYQTFIDGSSVPPVLTFLIVWFTYFVLVRWLVTFPFQSHATKLCSDWKFSTPKNFVLPKQEEIDGYLIMLVRLNFFDFDKNGRFYLGSTLLKLLKS
jgi:hypothetical protein